MRAASVRAAAPVDRERRHIRNDERGGLPQTSLTSVTHGRSSQRTQRTHLFLATAFGCTRHMRQSRASDAVPEAARACPRFSFVVVTKSGVAGVRGASTAQSAANSTGLFESARMPVCVLAGVCAVRGETVSHTLSASTHLYAHGATWQSAGQSCVPLFLLTTCRAASGAAPAQSLWRHIGCGLSSRTSVGRLRVAQTRRARPVRETCTDARKGANGGTGLPVTACAPLG